MEQNRTPKVHIVIGKNFGDEGKGLAADYFAMRAEEEGVPCLVIRHNGGAQAGHTVDRKEGGRFIFHQLASGSLRGADTYWQDTFLPDLLKLPEEAEMFGAFCKERGIGRQGVHLYASASCRCVCVDDVLLNMAIETARGASRHGSCGMGINEAVLRSRRDDSRITLGQVKGGTAEALFAQMRRNRREYLPERIRELEAELAVSHPEERIPFLRRCGEYGELLRNENVLAGAAEAMCRGAELVEPAQAQELLPGYGEVIFEGAQGLLLDEMYKRYAPHLTTSRTGLHNPAMLLRQQGNLPGADTWQAEAVYVSRTYVTRHGSGPLPYEGLLDPGQYSIEDLTNQPNEWQGSLRFAPHGSPEEFVRDVREDLKNAQTSFPAALFLTHLGETGGKVCSAYGNKPAEEWCRQVCAAKTFQNIYYSPSPFAEDVKETGKTE